MSSSTMQLAMAVVDMDAACNRHPLPALEDTETLTVLTLGLLGEDIGGKNI